mmetsp:Transcript_45148/g.139288  ORF Transcript_45148/g.139288 Transcript_45148/m.139288 type:complete len:306 (+) Transcript_45148:137-1054(+)
MGCTCSADNQLTDPPARAVTQDADLSPVSRIASPNRVKTPPVFNRSALHTAADWPTVAQSPRRLPQRVAAAYQAADDTRSTCSAGTPMEEPTVETMERRMTAIRAAAFFRDGTNGDPAQYASLVNALEPPRTEPRAVLGWLDTIIPPLVDADGSDATALLTDDCMFHAASRRAQAHDSLRCTPSAFPGSAEWAATRSLSASVQIPPAARAAGMRSPDSAASAVASSSASANSMSDEHIRGRASWSPPAGIASRRWQRQRGVSTTGTSSSATSLRSASPRNPALPSSSSVPLTQASLSRLEVSQRS